MKFFWFGRSRKASLLRVRTDAGILVGGKIATLRRRIKALEALNEQSILALIKAIDTKDFNISRHSANVACYAGTISRELKLSPSDTKRIRLAALLHDIGKIVVPANILNKPAKLSPEEYDIVKKHPVASARALSGIKTCQIYVPGILFHHERMDGEGYPDGLVGHDIPLDARIIAVADAFDAMTSDRPFRSKISIEEAIHRLKEGSGAQFDPVIVTAWVRIINRTMRENGKMAYSNDIAQYFLKKPCVRVGHQSDSDDR